MTLGEAVHSAWASLLARMHFVSLFTLLPFLALQAQERVLWRMDRSEVTFVSDAPMERISATNTKANGLLDPAKRSFAVRIPVVDFEGFNSPLQREHFNENYLESKRWPDAVFEGRIIESLDFSVPGEHAIRAKGRLTIHGVDVERIIQCRLIITPQGVRVTTTFDVPLGDHNIRIPRVVQQKLAAIAQVKVDVLFKPGSIAE